MRFGFRRLEDGRVVLAAFGPDLESLPESERGDYIEFTVLDMAEAKRFYGEAFGWSFTDYGPEDAAHLMDRGLEVVLSPAGLGGAWRRHPLDEATLC